jgi:beta-N-acetylhexosaminidase
MRPLSLLGLTLVALLTTTIQSADRTPPVDRSAERWVARTLKGLTPDEKVGQVLAGSFQSVYTSTDSAVFDELARQVRELHIGGFVVFGGSQPVPEVLLNRAYGSVTLGQPFAAASLANRLQALAKVPLLNSADFETGAGFRIAGATAFPRAMAFGAAGDERLAYEAGRITGRESRALGVQLDFAPVVDVNNNPRNPVINTRSFGEEPALVGRLASAVVRGMQESGVIAVLKHFPGHGDTAVDSHLGLPAIAKSIGDLESLELVPFRMAIGAGAAGVMVAHMAMPAVEPTPDTPATLSRAIVGGVLRERLGFDRLVVTDAMDMAGVTKLHDPGEAAVRAFDAGNDIVLHSPDDFAAFDAMRAAVREGRITPARLDASVKRVLEAKARLGLHREKLVDLSALADVVGTRAHQAVADEVSRRSLTLVKDERNAVPLNVPRNASVLYLSVVDYPSNWEIGAPSRTFLPELRTRWPNVTAVELSDQSTPAELSLVRASAPRYDAIIASVFVRAASASGRMDLAEPVARLLRDLAAMTAPRDVPYVCVLFGNPYTAVTLAGVPAMLLTYDFYDRAERSAVRALAGEAPIGGRLPIALPGVAARGHGLDRAASAAPATTGK